MKKKLLLPLIFLGVLILLLIPARFLWSEDETFEPPNEKSPVTDITVDTIQTNLARYEPGQPIKFDAELSEKPKNSLDMKITYYHLNDVVHEKIIQVDEKKISWEWTAPEEDFTGYYVEVSPLHNQDGNSTIGLDVSSSWDKFPRYGFLSDFSEKPEEEQKSIINQLNRYHINGLQFYDWHDEHHQPLKPEDDKPLSSWKNIANQPVSYGTVQSYIDLAHNKSMMAMSYNLLYGALSEATEDGVKKEWRLFKDQEQVKYAVHELPDDWKSDIYLTNPSNGSWQNYIFDQQQTVFDHLTFDGWHIDQLGSRGDVYDYNGDPVALDETFKGFLENAYETFEDKQLVMNAVNQFGQKQIANSSAPFLYTELWNPFKSYEELNKVLKENEKLSEGKKNTVLAAYMNYDKSNQEGTFNTPGILYTDALIFAQGGAHLELGEHMLSKEYFPHNKLEMSEELKNKMVSYYDFMVGYENLLRDGVSSAPLEITTENWVRLTSQPEKGQIYTFAKKQDNRKIVHFLNYFDATHMNWRDTNGTQSEPSVKGDLTVTIQEEKEVDEVWIASPDWNEGLPTKLNFTQEDGELTLTIPKIKYWDMVVLEYN
ncbi:cycloisomaltooligosaccharide glucanotransferase [Pontibacillus chungwhensis BH030062]|uniref:Cycloisomaltooligosaccharide glucanotransferase n=1 Tax=Pontibacillus chungwhensis BH030062 TaxID=1385513 RepID=A0A0A2UU42_9BACI|nr:glycoside hydrolase family 66 protein [Pontibacillus chungwhensis]KGP91424.1 cycloisomaltooligosaccharide glucanotransferase [Pontibacillus chungwhensis BH030062]